MDNWQVFLVIVAIVSFLAIVVPPIVKLTSAITKLNSSVDNLSSSLSKQDAENKASHKELWEHNDKQDDTLNRHETRITFLEHREEK